MNPLHVRTPLIESHSLSALAGRNVLLKLENTQPTGSFKIRGIGALCQDARDRGVGRFISSSGGNAGYAAAYAGRRLGVQTTVYVPRSTHPETIAKIQEQDAEVVVEGDVWDETDSAARRVAADTNALYVPPFDHPLIWKGHATIIDELVAEAPRPGAIVLSVGGGGLLCGVVEGLHAHGWQDVPVVAVETEGTASFSASQGAGRLVTLDEIRGIATSLGAKTVSRQTLEWSRRHTIRSVVMSDRDAVSACVSFAHDHRFLVEPACGASLAAVYNCHKAIMCSGSVVVIVCGGIGVDQQKLRVWSDQFNVDG